MGREKRENGKREERKREEERKTGEKRGLSNLCVEKIICQQIQF
jgi:hypothetical protein